MGQDREPSGAPDGVASGGARAAAARVLREPLVHFMALGLALYLGVMGVRALERPTVTIAAQDINQLVAYWQLQTQRAPTKAELAAIIQGRVDEELLAREAVRLGMDRDDLIIRRRLAQKMSFASEDLGDRAPSEAELKAMFERTRARYAASARISFRHVYFSADRGAGAARAAADAALAVARGGGAPAGDPSLLPQTYADADPDALVRDYGPEFVRQLETAPLQTWSGPVRSPFGVHILLVEGRADPVVPPFEAVRDQVLQNALAEERRARNETFLRRLRERYRVVVAGAGP